MIEVPWADHVLRHYTFDLTNALASFQGYINKIIVEKLNIFGILYLDDILIYTDDDGDRHVTAIW